MRSRKPNGYWSNRENCVNNASLFESLSSWEQHSSAAVASARQHGWLDECTRHMSKPKRESKWSLQEISRDASRYHTIGEWRRMSNGSYKATCKMGVLKDVSSHMLSFVAREQQFLGGELVAGGVGATGPPQTPIGLRVGGGAI